MDLHISCSFFLEQAQPPPFLLSHTPLHTAVLESDFRSIFLTLVMKSDSQLKPGHLRYYEAVLHSYLPRLASWTGRGSTASSLPGGSGHPGSPLVLQPVDTKEGSPVTAGQEWEVQLPCDLLMLPHGRIPTWLPLPPSPPLRLCPHGWRWVTVSSVLRSRGRMVIV